MPRKPKDPTQPPDGVHPVGSWPRTSHKSLAHLKISVLEAKNGKTKEEKELLKALKEKHKIK